MLLTRPTRHPAVSVHTQLQSLPLFPASQCVTSSKPALTFTHARPREFSIPKGEVARRCVAPPRARRSSGEGANVDIPSSRQEAIQQACAAIVATLNEGRGRMLLSVDIPVMDDSLAAQAELSTEIMRGLPAAWQKRSMIFVSDSYGPNDPDTTKSVGTACSAIQEFQGPVLAIVSAPLASDLVHINFLLEHASEQQDTPPSAVIVVNAQWTGISDDGLGGQSEILQANQKTLDAFQPAYAFIPVSVKAFVINAYEGAVVYNPSIGTSKDSRRLKNKERRSAGDGFGGNSDKPTTLEGSERPWKVYLHRNRQTWELVARMKSRPSQKDLEDAFYNVAATTTASPFAAGAKFLRNLTGK
jgi:hypothetical protein